METPAITIAPKELKVQSDNAIHSLSRLVPSKYPSPCKCPPPVLMLLWFGGVPVSALVPVYEFLHVHVSAHLRFGL